MTAQEIKALIASKIAGQGSMVDIGGALPKILDAIVDALPQVPEGSVLVPALDVSEHISINGGEWKEIDFALMLKLGENAIIYDGSRCHTRANEVSTERLEAIGELVQDYDMAQGAKSVLNFWGYYHTADDQFDSVTGYVLVNMESAYYLFGVVL